jgi:hypothetical protein
MWTLNPERDMPQQGAADVSSAVRFFAGKVSV